jgi:ferredoxin-NADP reductase
MQPLGHDACRLVLSRSDNFAYTAGQWVGVNFLNLPGELQGHLGRIGSPHPYSICTPPGDGSKFEVVIKSMGQGTWSQKVCDWANSSPDTSAIRAEISGPFGGLQVQLPLFKHVVLFAGGVGVTPLLSIFLNLLQKHLSGDEKRCKVVLVWAVRDASQIAWFEDAWANIAEEAACKEGFFEVRVFVTSDKTLNPVSGTTTSQMDVVNSRPSVAEQLEEMKNAFSRDVKETVSAGVAVLACGPPSLMADVYDQTQAAQTPDCALILHRETFVL